MKTQTLYPVLIIQFVFISCFPTGSFAQNSNCDAKTLEAFIECYGGPDAFSAHSINAVTTFIQAEDALNAGDFARAKMLVDNLFNAYPKGSNVWWNVFNDPNGANIGTPHAYYGLRMIEDIVDFQLNESKATNPQKATMKIVLVGCSVGIQPTTTSELQNGTGQFVTNDLDPKLKEDDYRIVKQSFEFFSTYVNAITHGQLDIDIEVIELPDLCMPVNVSSNLPYIASGSIAPVWEALNEEVKASTDWWWILYPSHVPELPVFDNEAFITGGMGLDQKGGPAFIIDDKWIVRKPAHLGKGDYSDIERRIYLPQWFQHEFFHHLYRAYPTLRLEVNGHDWFNRDFWPLDFEGQFEADYYAESLHKRLQADCVPLATKLITSVNDNQQQQFSKLNMDELVGSYSLDNVLNDWHIADIIKENDKYYWRNKANVQWEVNPNFAEGRLETGSDNPYPGQHFFIELYKNLDGSHLPGVTALKFNGAFYQKRFDLIREQFPIEIALGPYQAASNSAPMNTGNLLKTSGQFFWENERGDRWMLTPDTEDESFHLNEGSPTPEQKFQLILTEDACNTYVLGFEYFGDYYWKPKRSLQNESPLRIRPIEDLALPENFENYSIDLTAVFEDPESDPLLFFVTSSESSLINSTINEEQLVLTGGTKGRATILVMAVDANGGLATDEFIVEVGETVSTNDAKHMNQKIAILPNPAHNYVTITGALPSYHISICSVDKAFQQKLTNTGRELRIDLSHLPAGIYMILVSDPDSGSQVVRKVMKY